MRFYFLFLLCGVNRITRFCWIVKKEASLHPSTVLSQITPWTLQSHFLPGEKKTARELVSLLQGLSEAKKKRKEKRAACRDKK